LPAPAELARDDKIMGLPQKQLGAAARILAEEDSPAGESMASNSSSERNGPLVPSSSFGEP